MHYKDEPNEFESSYDMPTNTIEVNWRFMEGHFGWCMSKALSGTPISLRYRQAENRRNVIEKLKLYRKAYFENMDDGSLHRHKLKICARWPFMVVIMLKDGIEPMDSAWQERNAPISTFTKWHLRNFNGSGRHEDPSRPAPTT